MSKHLPEKAQTGLDDTQRLNTAMILADVQADLAGLVDMALNFHWNVRGRGFITLHGAFGTLYKLVDGDLDVTSEHLRALGSLAPSLRKALNATKVKQCPETATSEEMVKDTLENLEAVARRLRKAAEYAEDAGSCEVENYLVDLLTRIEKQAWFFRALS